MKFAERRRALSLPIALISMAALCGCSRAVVTKFEFADKSKLECHSQEATTSIRNSTVITACSRFPGTIFIGQGISTGRALLDTGNSLIQAGGTVGAGALIGGTIEH